MGVAKSLKSPRIQKVPREPVKELDLRVLVDASDDAIIRTDLSGTIVSWNMGAEKITGYKAEEILGRSVTVFLTPDHLDEHCENLGGCGAENISRNLRLLAFTRTAIASTFRYYFAGDGLRRQSCRRPHGCRDISKQKSAHEAMRLSEERFVLLSKTHLSWFQSGSATALHLDQFASPTLGSGG